MLVQWPSAKLVKLKFVKLRYLSFMDCKARSALCKQKFFYIYFVGPEVWVKNYPLNGYRSLCKKVKCTFKCTN